MVLEYPDNSHVLTSSQEEGCDRGYLKILAKEVQDAAVKRKMFSDLRDWKIGTTSVEVQAWKLVCERKGERVKVGKKLGKCKWERVCVERDPRVVCDVLSLKIEYCREEEEEARTKYKRYKSKLDKAAKSKTDKRKLARLVAQIDKKNKSRWIQELGKNSQKIEWASKKLNRKYPSALDAEEAWLRDVAEGRGANRKRIRMEIPVYAGVKISEDEIDALSLPPKYATYQAIKILRIKHQQQLRDAKFRYGMLDKVYDQDGNVIPEEAEELTQHEEVLAEQYRQVFDPENKELDFRRLRPTDVKSNPRVFIPKPRKNNKDEEELRVRNHLEQKVILDYLQKQEDCNNLTPSEKRGIKSLRARIESEEIIVYPTDKSGRLAVTSRASYSKQGEKHVAGDRIVQWKEVEEAQKTVKAHLWTLNRVFNPGQHHGEKAEQRTREAKQMANLAIPHVYLMAKDHKEVGPDGEPKTRPVCTASQTMNMEMSEWVTGILDAVLETEEDHEVI